MEQGAAPAESDEKIVPRFIGKRGLLPDVTLPCAKAFDLDGSQIEVERDWRIARNDQAPFDSFERVRDCASGDPFIECARELPCEPLHARQWLG